MYRNSKPTGCDQFCSHLGCLDQSGDKDLNSHHVGFKETGQSHCFEAKLEGMTAQFPSSPRTG